MTELTYIYEVDLLDHARVVDGDTFYLYVKLGFRQLGYVEIRLNGWDCPETRGPLTNQHERDQSARAKAAVVAWLKSFKTSRVLIRTQRDPERYGRWLGDVWAEDKDGHTINILGERLSELGLASEYHGTGKRWRDTYGIPS